jgi:hypothetical protein
LTDEEIKIAANIEMLSVAWAQIMSDVKFPQDFDGTPTQATYHVAGLVEERIRDHIFSSGDRRLFSLMHLLGHASLRMEQYLWPDEYEQISREIELAVREVDDQNAVFIPHEQVKAEFAVRRAALQARIDDKMNPAKLHNDWLQQKVQESRVGLVDGSNERIAPDAWQEIRAKK